nr:non-ribosomal peptide synthetase [Rhodanobacter sp. K2T2]
MTEDSIATLAHGDRIPLSFAQQSLWLASQREGSSAIYHIPGALSLKGVLDVAALNAALNGVFARHDALRSVVVHDADGMHVRLLAPLPGIALDEVDMRGRDDRATAWQEFADEETQRPFDLERGPLLRAALVRIEDDEHILILTLHHLIADGWSLALLADDIAAHYRAFVSDGSIPATLPSVQYPAFAAWQRQRLSGARMDVQTAYWRDRLADLPASLNLPIDRPRPPHQDHSGAFLPIAFDAATTKALKQWCGRQDVTLFTAIMAAWAVVLARLSHETDLVIGTPVANRRRSDVEQTIGCFVNTLALRVELGGNPSLAELVGRVRRDVLAAQDHQDLPFEQVVEIVNPVRSSDRTAIFQAMFTWQNTARSALSLPGIDIRPLHLSQASSRYDIKLDLGEEGDGIVGGFIYATALFDADSVSRHIRYLQAVVAQMLADDTQRILEIALADHTERALIAAWNTTARVFPTACLGELFEQQVRRTPAAIAIQADGVALSYAALNAQANRLAHRLVRLGVGPDRRVAICTCRSVAMAVAMLAVLKAGGAYVPLDPVYSSDRLGRILGDAAASVLLLDADGRHALGDVVATQTHVLALDELPNAWADEPESDLHIDGLTPDHLAYVIYTSGSTGEPKGVMVEHRSVVNFWAAIRGPIYPDDDTALRVAWNASFSFDMSIKAFSQLLSGHTVVLLPQAVRVSAPALLAFLRDERIDAFDTTPSQLRGLLAEGLLILSDRPRRVLLGGEPIDAAMWSQLATAPWLQAYNMYGPTECTVDVTITAIRDPHGPVHIGRPLANMRVHLRDAQGRDVPLGVAGEIYVAGIGVARGYFDRPALTAERFIADPLDAAGRLYRTGDRGRYLPDGRIQYLGRHDDQVKVRGFRIELGEIEARLSEHGAVHEATVLAQADAQGDTRLIAYVIPASAQTVSAASLRDHLAARLPEYMVPSAFVSVEHWPLTRNGKLDRRALPAPDERAFANRDYEPPRGAVETAIASLWSELLGVERIGRNDHFFELGGHSLSAVRMLLKLRKQYGCQIAMGELFEHPTVAALSKMIEHSSGESDELPMPTIPRDAALPLSFAQQRLWFLARFDAANPTYHIPVALQLTGEVDRSALTKSLATIFSRHEALRSMFVSRRGQPEVVLIDADRTPAIADIDLSAEGAAATLDDVMAIEAAAPFDLEHGPLIRFALVRLGAQKHVLLITLHHIVADGWSIDILVQELSHLYGAFRSGIVPQLSPLSVQYPDYAAWQKRWLDGDRQQKQREYWITQLKGAPALLELPGDRPRPVKLDHAGGSVPIVIDERTTAALKAWSHERRATLFMVLTAAWSAVLSRLSGQDDIVIGSPAANRERPETEGVVGLFVNSLALRIGLSPQVTATGLLDRVRQVVLEAQDHKDLPFEQVVDIVQPPRRTNHTPLFQVMFTWQGQTRREPVLDGLEVRMADAGQPFTKFDLELFLGEDEGCIVGGMNYSTALFDRPTIERHVGYIGAMLQGMVANTTKEVQAIALLGDDERRFLLHEWNSTAVPYDQEIALHMLFEARCRAMPDVIALQCEGRTMSYVELNQAANRLAHFLVASGVGVGDRVAACVSRDMTSVVTLMGILKSGAAYVPVDPSYPEDRIRFIVEDAQPRLVVCDGQARGAAARALGGSAMLVDVSEAIARSDLPTTDLGLTIRADQIAYVIYTSGSTGRPKGVMGMHRPVVNLIEWIASEFTVGPNDLMFFTSSLSFDLSVYDIFGILASGGCLRIATQDELSDPRLLARALMTSGATFWDSAPAVFQQLVPFFGAMETGPASSLRLAFFSGDWIPLEFHDVLRRHFPNCQMIALGGATEATVWSNYYRVQSIRPEWFSIPYGRPIQNAKYYVLDDRFEPVPWGVRGDLYIGGECLTAGYFSRDDLNQERFVVDPHSSVAGARMYRTGDLARLMPDGQLQFLGRNDQQVKIRGFRVELGEIETRLTEHARIRDAAVVFGSPLGGDRRLLAYVVPSGDGGVTAVELRSYLQALVPEYMIPSAFVSLDAMPLTPNGKVDRKALPEPDDSAFVHRSHEAPSGAVEEAIAAIWMDLLGLEHIGRHDHFFELGGNSLLAIAMLERLRDNDIELDVRTLFEHPVLADLAMCCNEIEEVRL